MEPKKAVSVAVTVSKAESRSVWLKIEKSSFKGDKESEELLKKIGETIAQVNRGIETFKFGQALHVLYDFVWRDFADTYIEYSKSKDDKHTKELLSFTLLNILKLLHPFMPFITEEIYQNLDTKDKDQLMIEHWPTDI